MNSTSVLFLCVHNSARSQMAEAYLKHFGGDHYKVESAGLEPGALNPLAIEVMKEEGIDISKNPTNDVFQFFREGRQYDVVITVCDREAAERCPVFPGLKNKISWSFDDPSKFSGTHDERVAATRIVRNNIKNAVLEFISGKG